MSNGQTSRLDSISALISGKIPMSTLTNFMNVVDSQFDRETAGQLNSAITAMMLQSLPEMHALRREGFRPSRS
jgi:hypothetical protein